MYPVVILGGTQVRWPCGQGVDLEPALAGAPQAPSPQSLWEGSWCHHGATMALNKGFTAPIVMALGGWKTERMMRRYAAVTDQTLRVAAEAVSGSEVGFGCVPTSAS